MIPWEGDVVKINPAGCTVSCMRNFRRIIGDGEVTVIRVEMERNYPFSVNIDIAMPNSTERVGVCLPDGRFFQEPLGAPPLFTFVSGVKNCFVKLGYWEPVPVPGDKFIENGGIKDYIKECDCGLGCGSNWPYGNMECGAHWYGDLCYDIFKNGWLYNGVLTREWVSEIIIPSDIIDLKKLNTQSNSTVCASCGNQLKDPGMGPIYKHCPICEP